MRPRIRLDEYDWRMLIFILIMVIVNVLMVVIINSVSYRHSAEKYTKKYLDKIGYFNVAVGQFVPKECECAKNGGYEFTATNINGDRVARKACHDGKDGFIIYELYGCNKTPRETR